MKAALKIGIISLFLVSYLTPAMACMVSNVPMSAEERACCRMMKDQCEQMGMAVSHGCCQKTPKSAQENAVATGALSRHPVVVAVMWLSVVERLNLNPITSGFTTCTDTSPTQPPPRSIAILRI